MALSWKEPYGSLMLPPFDKAETRTRPTKYRGPVLICTSQKPYPWHIVQDISGPVQFQRITDMMSSVHFQPTGHAIAVGDLVDCRPTKKSDEDKCFVGGHTYLYVHVYENVRPIKPFPWKGKQGWKKVPQEIINQIEFIV